MMDPSAQELLCVKNIIHGMINKIVSDQGNNKGSGETTDGFTGLKRHMHSDHIPLSCPVIRSSSDKLLSESDKSFLMFLDDMQNLTTKDRTRVPEVRLPTFRVYGRSQSHQDNTEESLHPVCDQSHADSDSDMLTLEALVNSQESDHPDSFDSLDYGEERVTAPETKLLSSASSKNHQDRQNTDCHHMHLPFNCIASGDPCNEGHSWHETITDITAPDEACIRGNNMESVVKLDREKRFPDSFLCYTKDRFDDSTKLPSFFSEDNSTFDNFQQFVNGQLQNVYNVVDKSTTDIKNQIANRMQTDTIIELTGITKRSINGQMSSACLTQEPSSLIEGNVDKDNDQLDSQSKFDAQRNVQVGYSSPTEPRKYFESCSTNADEAQCSVQHDYDLFEQNICRRAYHSARAADEQPSPNTIHRFEQLAGNNHVQTIDIASDICNTAVKRTASSSNHKGISSTEITEQAQVNQYPEMTKSFPHHFIFDSDLKEELTIPSVCIETGNSKDRVTEEAENKLPKEENINQIEMFHSQQGISCRPQENWFVVQSSTDLNQDTNELSSDQNQEFRQLSPDQNQAFRQLSSDQNQDTNELSSDQNQDTNELSSDHNQEFRQLSSDKNEDFRLLSSDQNQEVFRQLSSEQNQDNFRQFSSDQEQDIRQFSSDQNQDLKLLSSDQNQHFKQISYEQNQKDLIQLSSDQKQEDLRQMHRVKDKLANENICLKQEHVRNEQTCDSQIQTQRKISEAIDGKNLEAGQNHDATGENSTTKETRTHFVLEPNCLPIEPTSISHQPSECIDTLSKEVFLKVNETVVNYTNLPCLPSSPVIIRQNELDPKALSRNSGQCSSFTKDRTERDSDQMVPDRDHIVPDQSVAFHENYAHSEHEEAQSLYKAEEDKLKDARLPSPKFKWKYRPSCDGEDEGLAAPPEDMELVLGNIQPLVTVQCSRSLRIGLSRKQKVKRLHKHVS